MRTRSIGVTVFAVLFLFFGALGLVGSVWLPQVLKTLLGSPGLEAQHRAQLQAAYDILSAWQGFSIAMSLLQIVAGIGLLQVRSWARWLALCLAGASLTWKCFQVMSHLQALTGQQLLVDLLFGLLPAMIWSGLVIRYFLLPSVKAQFQK